MKHVVNDWADRARNASGSYDMAIKALRERLEKSRVQIGNCTLYCEHAAFIVPTLLPVDALVTDPPYGLDEANGKNASRSTSKAKARDYGCSDWDKKPVDSELMDVIRAKARWQIIFGGNYYTLPPTSCWLVWDNLNSGDFADCELAWTNLPKAVRRLQYMWNGMLRRERNIPREHPTQKPIGVMSWCIEHLPSDCNTIFDPFMGSGTTGVAAVKLGKRFIGIERERKYFEIACRRIHEAYAEPDMFAAPLEPKTVAPDMFEDRGACE